MRQPIRRAPKSDNNKPSSSAVASSQGAVSVNAPLLANQQQQYDTSALDTEHKYQADRLKEIGEIEQQTAEVQGMFQDFKVMVDQQDEGIDQVDKNVNKADDHVVKGNEQLKKASETQKSSRKWMCCIIVLVVIIIAAIMVVMAVMGKL